MELAEVIRKRKMVRNYTEEPVDPAVVEQILAHAVHAPSAGFSQGWAFLVLDDPADRDRFWNATSPEDQTDTTWLRGMRKAPVIIVALANKGAYLDRYAEPDKGWSDRDEARWPVPYWDIDTGMASLLMLLTAVDNQLGACFFGITPDRLDAFRSAFDVPQSHHPIGAVTVGHPADQELPSSRRRGRKRLDDVVHRGRWGGTAT